MDLATHLRTELKERQGRNPSFSMRSFAKWLGISPAQLSQMMSGKRKVTPKILNTVSDRLGLSPVERLNFMKSSLSQSNDQKKVQDLLLSEDQFRLISDWYHFAILSLTQTDNAKGDPRWIARRLGISVGQAQEAVMRLVRMGLLETDPIFKQTSEPIMVAAEIRSDAIRAFHKQNLSLATEKIDTVDVSLRVLRSATMSADPKKLQRAKKLIDDFATQISELMESGRTTEVYTLAIQLFPNSQGDGK